MGVRNPAGPLTHGFRYSVLQGRRTAFHRMDLRSQKAHPVHVQRLPLRIFLSHEDLTLHVHQRRRRGCGYPVLPGSCLRDDTCFSHFLCQKYLSQHIIDLVGARMVQILPFQVDFCPAQVLCHASGIIKPGRPPRVFVQKLCKLPVEFRIVFIMIVGFLQLQHRIHQRLRNVLAAVDSKSSIRHVSCSSLSSSPCFFCLL